MFLMYISIQKLLRSLLIKEHITVSKHAVLVGLLCCFGCFFQVCLISATGHNIDQHVIKDAREETLIRYCQPGAKKL